MIKTRGPRSKPWWTPWVTGVILDVHLFAEMYWVNQEKAEPLMPTLNCRQCQKIFFFFAPMQFISDPFMTVWKAQIVFFQIHSRSLAFVVLIWYISDAFESDFSLNSCRIKSVLYVTDTDRPLSWTSWNRHPLRWFCTYYTCLSYN